MSRVASKCLNCGERRSCIKIEARAPLPQSVLVWDAVHNCHTQCDYEPAGPMVEICRACLGTDIGTLARYLLESL